MHGSRSRPPLPISNLGFDLSLNLKLGLRGHHFIFQASRPKFYMVVYLDLLYLYLALVWTSASASTLTSASEVNISLGEGDWKRALKILHGPVADYEPYVLVLP